MHVWQVSDKERDMELGALFKDVATIIAEKCLNPGTQRPYTVSMVERALRDCHFSVDPKRGAKQQALHVRAPVPAAASACKPCSASACERHDMRWACGTIPYGGGLPLCCMPAICECYYLRVLLWGAALPPQCGKTHWVPAVPAIQALVIPPAL